MVSYSIRLDDPGRTSPHELEKEIFGLLDRYSLRATVAVIPAHAEEKGEILLDQAAVPHLLQAHRDGVIEIAQHGYSHSPFTSSNSAHQSEFVGMPPSQQAWRINAGRNILETVFGIRVTGFVPPWNTCDQTTVDILHEAGFKYLSAGWEHDLPKMQIVSVPRTCNIWELRGALIKARKFQDNSPHVVAVMHPYDFKEIDPIAGRITLNELAALFEWLHAQNDLSCKLLSEIADEISNDPGAWLSFHRNRAKLPWLIRKHVPREMLMKASFLRVLLSPLS